MGERFDPRLVPGSIRDARSEAFAAAARHALAEPEFRKLLVEEIDAVDARLLPFLIREFGLHKFVEPGMSELAIRRMLKGSFELHKEIGYIRGVRFGLTLIGVRITHWQQWFQRTPMGAPGTHRIRIALDEAIFPDEGITFTARFQRLVGRMIRHTTRASQDIAIELTTKADPALLRVGIGLASRISIRMLPQGDDRLAATTEPRVGLAIRTHLSVRMEG